MECSQTIKRRYDRKVVNLLYGLNGGMLLSKNAVVRKPAYDLASHPLGVHPLEDGVHVLAIGIGSSPFDRLQAKCLAEISTFSAGLERIEYVTGSQKRLERERREGSRLSPAKEGTSSQNKAFSPA